jgi:arginyl-tRNA synthetase
MANNKKGEALLLLQRKKNIHSPMSTEAVSYVMFDDVMRELSERRKRLVRNLNVLYYNAESVWMMCANCSKGR